MALHGLALALIQIARNWLHGGYMKAGITWALLLNLSQLIDLFGGASETRTLDLRIKSLKKTAFFDVEGSTQKAAKLCEINGHMKIDVASR